MRWLDRNLFTSPVCYALCLSEVKFKRELKRLGAPASTPFLSGPQAHATAHFSPGDTTACCIVCLGSTEGMELEQVYALLVHEAVHIWQDVKHRIGEDNPSSEFEAYAIQNISQELMLAYKLLTK